MAFEEQLNGSHPVLALSTKTTGVILLSDEATIVLQWLIFTLLCPAIDVFGLGTNIINIICFVKQGFKDPVNISFLGLAVSDIGCVTLLIWCNLCYAPAFLSGKYAFDPIEISYLTAGIPHTVFTRATGFITAIITMERCLCITLPLQVRNIVTPKRVSVVIVGVMLVSISSVVPVYVVNRLDMKFFPHKNTTLLGLIYAEGREDVERVCYVINNVFIPYSCFTVIIICTCILVITLKKTAKWRTKNASTGHVATVSNRNQKVAQMVVIISTLFICCFIPMSAVFITMSLEPDFFLDGKYKNLVIVLGGIGILLESINSSANIFVYYYMSLKYRNVFHQLFPFCKNKLTDPVMS